MNEERRTRFLSGNANATGELGEQRAIKRDFGHTGYNDMNWIHVVRDTDQWLALVSAVLNLQIPQTPENFLTV
jgi:hypothetical protein